MTATNPDGSQDLPKTADIIVIGAGIAGASLAAQLPDGIRVVILEMEDRPGFHSTGRSAATWEPSYGPAVVRALTRASGPFLRSPPDGFAGAALLSRRGVLMNAPAGTPANLIAQGLEAGFHEIDAATAKACYPLLKMHSGSRYFFDDVTMDVDVDLLHGGFLRLARRKGASPFLRCDVKAGGQAKGVWQLETSRGRIAAPIVVNAAGAWADLVATRLGVAPIGLVPKRRSIAVVPGPAGVNVMDWPLLFPAGEAFYAKPSGGKLLVSPADADPVEPHDAFADDMRIAEAIAAFEDLVDHTVTRVERTWGGLRTFAPDGEFVIGFDAVADGFFWLAGQGGYGIQTSPAAGQLAAALLMRQPVPASLRAEGISEQVVAPKRFTRDGS